MFMLALLLSCIRKIKNFLKKVLPSIVYLAVVAVNKRGEVIGFAFVKLTNYLYGDLGIGVRDDYHGKGVGSKLMSNLIGLARKAGLKGLRLTVLANNYRAIRLYEKFGFKKTKFVKDGELYRGRRYDCVEMWLHLKDLKVDD
jgi:ribosomal protein S18 acetylase RimI-like enzyme